LVSVADGTGYFMLFHVYVGTGSVEADLLKFLPNGDLDPTFNSSMGYSFWTLGYEDTHLPWTASGTMIDGQGAVNIAYAVNGERFFGAAKISPEGAEDKAFTSLAKHEMGAGEPLWMTLDKSGRMFVAGHLDSAAVLSRTTKAGALDATFGNAGLAPSLPSTRWQCVVADASERAVVVGIYAEADAQAIRLGRYGQNGFPDVTYGVEGNGFATLVQGSEVSVSQCKLDRQGRLLVAGSVRASAGAPSEPFLMRIWN
jgi:hypothetical protein